MIEGNCIYTGDKRKHYTKGSLHRKLEIETYLYDEHFFMRRVVKVLTQKKLNCKTMENKNIF